MYLLDSHGNLDRAAPQHARVAGYRRDTDQGEFGDVGAWWPAGEELPEGTLS
jgi:hypothetical protein